MTTTEAPLGIWQAGSTRFNCQTYVPPTSLGSLTALADSQPSSWAPHRRVQSTKFRKNRKRGIAWLDWLDHSWLFTVFHIAWCWSLCLFVFVGNWQTQHLFESFESWVMAFDRPQRLILSRTRAFTKPAGSPIKRPQREMNMEWAWKRIAFLRRNDKTG